MAFSDSKRFKIALAYDNYKRWDVVQFNPNFKFLILNKSSLTDAWEYSCYQLPIKETKLGAWWRHKILKLKLWLKILK